jgi:hypothetical protein
MLAADSLEEKRLTGTETRPNEIVADPMDLAAIVSVGWVGGLIYRQNRATARRWCRLKSATFCTHA